MHRTPRKAAPTRHAVAVPLRQAAAPVQIMEQEEGTAEMPFEEGAHDALDPDLRHRMISEAAYHLYAERGYADGYDLDDWLQAETQIDHLALGAGEGEGAAEESLPSEPHGAGARSA